MDTSTFNYLSLCSGVGGLDLGFKLAIPSSRAAAYVEREAACIEVMATRMEEGCLDQAPIFSDVAAFDGKPWRGLVDCIIGGYPCQPFSVAGKQRGVDDPRHLWPHIARIIREVEPTYCFFENVSNHLNIGFDIVVRELQAMGYEVEAGLFSAEEIGAPHKRERLFILGYSARNEQRWQRLGAVGREGEARRSGGDVAYSERRDSERRRESGIVGSTEATQFGQTLQRQWDGNTVNDCVDNVVYSARLGEREQEHETGTKPRGDARQDASRGLHIVHPKCESELDNPASTRCERGEPGSSATVRDEARISESSGRCIELANAEREGLSRRPMFERDGRAQQPTPERVRSYNLGRPFPPGPAALDEWRAILGIRPDLAPAISEAEAQTQSELCGLADGMGPMLDRVERLRAGGNGVVPLVAAYALIMLVASLRARCLSELQEQIAA